MSSDYTWNTYDTVYIRQPNVKPATGTIIPIAGFDFDSTLVYVASAKPPYRITSDTDWVLTSDLIIPWFQQSVKNGWLIVIFSNQQIRGKNKDELIALRISKFNKIMDYMGINPYIFFATGNDVYRKPNGNMFDLFLRLTLVTPHPQSFYCGDSSGPVDPWIPYQWNDTDRKFAENIKLEYKRPMDVLPQQPFPELSLTQEIIILVGQQGSGKSFTSQQIIAKNSTRIGLSQYQIVSGDELKSNKVRMLSLTEQILDDGNSPIIDSTNPTIADRATYINLAQSRSLPARIFWCARPGRDFNKLRPHPVPEVALNTYSARFQRPLSEEGAVVVRVN